jgi:hypothetical protein
LGDLSIVPIDYASALADQPLAHTVQRLQVERPLSFRAFSQRQRTSGDELPQARIY